MASVSFHALLRYFFLPSYLFNKSSSKNCVYGGSGERLDIGRNGRNVGMYREQVKIYMLE